MKVKQIKIYQLNWGQLSPIWHPLVVQIETDQGISGYGEAGIAYGTGMLGVTGLIKELGHRIIGKDPLLINQIWQDIYEHTFWAKGGGTIFYSAVSALDIALWDIKGKAAEFPVYQLFGGPIRNTLPAYASHIEYGWGPFSRYVQTPHDFGRLAKRAVKAGYQAIKVDPVDQESHQQYLNHRGLLTNGQLTRAYNRVEAIRRNIGDNIQIIIDCHANLRVESAIQLSKVLAPLNIYYLEEPIPTLSAADYRLIAKKVSIPLAVGEHLTTPKTFLPYIANHYIGVVQPDLGTCGGFSLIQRINSLALANDINLQLHVCGSPIATAAALQFEAVAPNFVFHEQHEITLKDAYRESAKYQMPLKDGSYQLTNRPGIGQELSEQAKDNASSITIK
ncbi:mandelate racemase/muconate lactonizing enzyme family protein [Limosilactobacillus sp.]|jgi:L-alanine-DL-glutamate epimerase-like enolase superfamily enzyme|uniref:mandelate racemase/muconate lactonizing enzyme family protein n=1 Tax=Limosilactobacillus sp. TaxID=2773925 RepID=UPI0025BFE183|nr:mandelate racemase/muconate lactonizing enzyme family protein [Limosilactobacillus sp.]MCI2031509.1 mandelate racemase/muconate lactonizing enzyme family protein [Limosilactobacillus sp.]